MVQTMGTTGFYSQICKHFLYIFVKKVGDSDLVLLGKTWSSKMDELPVAAAHDSNCLKVPQGYKKHKPKGFNTGNIMIDDQSSSKDINTQTTKTSN